MTGEVLDKGGDQWLQEVAEMGIQQLRPFLKRLQLQGHGRSVHNPTEQNGWTYQLDELVSLASSDQSPNLASDRAKAILLGLP